MQHRQGGGHHPLLHQEGNRYLSDSTNHGGHHKAKSRHRVLPSTDSNLVLNIVYFVPDVRKAGGAYMEITGSIKKLIPHEKLLILDTDTRIPVEDIVEVYKNSRERPSKSRDSSSDSG